MRIELEPVIAVRNLKGPDGEPVSVSIGLPRVFDDLSGWYCPFCIRFGNQEIRRCAGGADSLGALQLALSSLRFSPRAAVRDLAATHDLPSAVTRAGKTR